MADDIDIEEHDILQNPVIRNIFPDISVLKKELDFYPDDHAPVIKEEPPCEALIITQHEKGTNKTQGPPTTTTILQNKDEKNNFKKSCLPNSSKIILGSKPAKQRKNNKEIILQTKVALKDIGPYLNQSSRFCNYCKTLFPKHSLFENHLYTKHFSSVPMKIKTTEGKNSENVNSDLFSTTIKGANIQSGANSDNNQKKEASCLNHACFHCDQVFNTQKLLVDHLYLVLESKNKNFAKKTGCDEAMKKSSDLGAGVDIKYSTSKPQRISPKLQSNVNISPRCDICSITYASVGNLNRHLKMVHGEKTHTAKRDKFIRSADNHKKNRLSPDELISQETKLLLDDVKNEEIPLQRLKDKLNKLDTKQRSARSLFYRCPVCSYFFKKEENFEVHMIKKHHSKSCPRPQKVKFKKQCLYCAKEYSTPKILNCHLLKCHKVLTEMKNKISNDAIKESTKVGLRQNVSKRDTNQFNESLPVLKSTLFMCSKCDVHFLNAKMTSSHKEHIEILINWKCPKCSRIFKSEDQIWHERQHKCTDKFTVHELSGTITSKNKVLYCCSQCTVHFDEADFLKHRGKCQKEPPSSSYCHVCDILVDLNIKNCHDNCHSSLEFGREHFTLVDADILNDFLSPPTNLAKAKTVERRHNRTNKNNEISKYDILSKFNIEKKNKRLSYFFCESCKCFVSVSIYHRLHLRGRCAHLPRTICKFCGIILTPSGTKSHRKQHQVKNITLQDLKFYDIHTCKMICPPIPKLVECKICHVQLLKKNLKHVCDEEQLVTCDICACKFSSEALNLHMAYHNYSIYKNRDKKCDLILSKKEPVISVSIDMKKILYTCKNCNATVDCYDKVIEHCHVHILRNEKLFVNKRCEECNLIFQQPCFNDHLNFHNKNAMLNVEHLKFDTDYFLSTEWLNQIFQTLSHEKVGKIIEESLYEKEKRVKMEVIQKGVPNLTVYQCTECHYYVAPEMIYSHIKKSCSVERNFSCYICNLNFDSRRSRELHEPIHKTAIIEQKSYRILRFIKLDGFNYNDDLKNHQYVLYECRNCYSAIDRCQTGYHKCNLTRLSKCDHCGLLINQEDLNDHVLKHKSIKTYKQDNIKVVLFGEKQDTILPQPQPKPSFSGIICDYTLYQCLKCNICIKIIHFVSNHNCCLINSCKSFCNKCHLYFCTSNYKSHKLSHDSDPDFLRENMKIICFDLSKEGLANKTVDISDEKNNRGSISSSKENEISLSNELKPLNNEEEKEKKVVRFYKCNCGLNFLNESDINSHIEECGSRLNVSKQRCSKCELLFTPKILFNHLLNHHGNKKYKFIFEVIEMSKLPKDK